MLVTRTPGKACRWYISFFSEAKKFSAVALSHHTLVQPTLVPMPRAWQNCANPAEVYWASPAVAVKHGPGPDVAVSDGHLEASVTRLVRMWSATCQPVTMRCAAVARLLRAGTGACSNPTNRSTVTTASTSAVPNPAEVSAAGDKVAKLRCPPGKSALSPPDTQVTAQQVNEPA